MISDGEMLPHNYWQTGVKGAIHTSRFGTWIVTVMGKPHINDISEAIDG